MNAVRKHDDGRQGGDQLLRVGGGGFARVSQTLHAGLDFGEAADVRLRANGDINQSPLLPGTGIVEELDAVGLGSSQGFKVADQFVGGGDALARGEGQNLLHGGHGGIVDGTGPHLELGLGEGCRGSEEKHKESAHISSRVDDLARAEVQKLRKSYSEA